MLEVNMHTKLRLSRRRISEAKVVPSVGFRGLNQPRSSKDQAMSHCVALGTAGLWFEA